jgi:hypothetical protein
MAVRKIRGLLKGENEIEKRTGKEDERMRKR